MKKYLSAFIISFVFIGLSYFVNNSGQCCDLVFKSGWPFPYYGGSGGFVGVREDKIIIQGLIYDFVFWYLVFGFISRSRRAW